MRRVVIVGMYAPYLGPFDEGVEVWGCNFTYRQQPNMSRLYAFDPIDRVFLAEDPDFLQTMAGLDIPIMLKDRHPDIPKSEAYPRLEILRKFFGDAPDDVLLKNSYFTNTIAYMIAHAIYEGVDELTMHRVMVLPPSVEYISQKPCLDFWCGVALGRGIRLRISEDSNLCKPFPWESGRYGYERVKSRSAIEVVSSAARIAAQMPVEFLEEVL